MDGTVKIGGSASGHSDQRTGKNTAPFFNGSGALCKVDSPFSLVCLCMLLLRKDSDNKTEVYRYQFSLTQDEVSEFKKNIDVSMLCELSLLYYQPTNFTVFQKAFNPLDG